jgi:hypothetical protein
VLLEEREREKHTFPYFSGIKGEVGDQRPSEQNNRKGRLALGIGGAAMRRLPSSEGKNTYKHQEVIRKDEINPA